MVDSSHHHNRSHATEWPLLAIWSRSEARATPLLPTINEYALVGRVIDMYHCPPLPQHAHTRFAPDCKAHWGDDGLDAILADPRVRAVVIALPAQAQLQIAAKALAAGKHVLQEKPIGATMQEAVDLLTLYKQQYSSKLMWGVAEN